MTGPGSVPMDELKTRLAALLRRGHEDERAFGDTLTPTERERTGTADTWAPKEIIAHLGYWRERENERAQALARGEAGPVYDDFQAMNTESFADLAAHSWETAIERSGQSTEALIATMEALSDTVLMGPARPPTETGTVSLLEMIINNGYAHPQQHLAEMSAARGDAIDSSAIQRRMLDTIIALDAGPQVTANARYNLACALATTGPLGEVLALLRQSFADNPRLIAWARQDSDLDPLRDDPNFQTMIAEEQG